MNQRRKIILGVILIGIVAFASIGIVLFLDHPITLDSKIQQLMDDGDIPSFAAGIVINDTLVWSKGYGDQPSLDTVYMIGSVTKIFTATAIMQLYDDGTLDLDADVNDYIPFSVRHPMYPSTPITPRLLLTHKSGIASDVSNQTLWDFDTVMITWANDNLGAGLPLWSSRPTLAEFLNGSLNPGGPYYSPENWVSQPGGPIRHYSNTGFLLLAYIVEQLTNTSYMEYLQENVLEPLDMTNTGFNYTDFVGRNAIPYAFRDGQNSVYPHYNQYNYGGGAVRTTVPDLANLLIAHMNQGHYDDSQILSPQTIDLMQTSQFSMSGVEFGGFTYVGQGLGWFLFTNNTIAHGGATPGFLAQIAFKTVSNGKYGILFMVNRGASLVEDNYLVNTFFPSMISTLFDEAARLFNM